MSSVPHTLLELLEIVHEKGFPWALDCVFDTFNKLLKIEPNQSWKKILNDASEVIVDFLGADASTVRLYEPYHNKTVSFGAYSFSIDKCPVFSQIEESIASEVVTLGRSRVVNSLPCAEDKPGEGDGHYKSMLAVPLIIELYVENQDDLKGALHIYYQQGQKEFSPVEIRVAEMMAQRVSYVLARKRILDMKRVNEKKEWLVQKLFSKITVERGVKMKDLFKMMVDELADIIKIQSCSLFTISDDGSEAMLETGFPENGGYHTIGQIFAINEHPYLYTAINADRPLGDFEYERIYPSYLLIKDPLKSEIVTPNLKNFTVAHNINSILYVPLRLDDRVKYLLVFDALEQRRHFSYEDIEILTFFGKELTHALEIERLDDILHDFKNPAIAIAGFAKRVRKMICRGALETESDEMLKYVDVVIHEGMRLQEMAMNLYPIARPEVLDLVQIAKERFLINREAINEQKLSHIELDSYYPEAPVNVLVPKLALERVLDNLLNNATKAIPAVGGNLVIKVEVDDEHATVEIANTGRIPPDEIEKLSATDFKGRGLNIVYRFVKSMNGDVDVELKDDTTTFKIKLPIVKNFEK